MPQASPQARSMSLSCRNILAKPSHRDASCPVPFASCCASMAPTVATALMSGKTLCNGPCAYLNMHQGRTLWHREAANEIWQRAKFIGVVLTTGRASGSTFPAARTRERQRKQQPSGLKAVGAAASTATAEPEATTTGLDTQVHTAVSRSLGLVVCAGHLPDLPQPQTETGKRCATITPGPQHTHTHTHTERDRRHDRNTKTPGQFAGPREFDG